MTVFVEKYEIKKITRAALIQLLGVIYVPWSPEFLLYSFNMFLFNKNRTTYILVVKTVAIMRPISTWDLVQSLPKVGKISRAPCALDNIWFYISLHYLYPFE